LLLVPAVEDGIGQHRNAVDFSAQGPKGLDRIYPDPCRGACENHESQALNDGQELLDRYCPTPSVRARPPPPESRRAHVMNAARRSRIPVADATGRLWFAEDMVALVEAQEAAEAPRVRGPYKPRQAMA
jgi:hypothetical protein